MILNSLMSHTIATSLRHFHTSIGMSSGPNALLVFIIFKAFSPQTLELSEQIAYWCQQMSRPTQS
jgi:hypothetical protein